MGNKPPKRARKFKNDNRDDTQVTPAHPHPLAQSSTNATSNNNAPAISSRSPMVNNRVNPLLTSTAHDHYANASMNDIDARDVQSKHDPDEDDESESESEEIAVANDDIHAYEHWPITTTNVVRELDASQRARLDTNGLNKCLVDGYVRELQCLLHRDVDLFRIVPDGVVHLCFDFYVLTRTMMFFVSQELHKNPHGLYIVDTENASASNPQNWHAQVHDLGTGHVITESMPHRWVFDECGAVMVPSFEYLPDALLAKLDHEYEIQFSRKCNEIDADLVRFGAFSKRKYDVIFNCSSSSCSATIMDQRQYHQNSTMQTVYAFQWEFDKLEFGSANNFVLYSWKHGLLSIGGARANCNFVMDFASWKGCKPQWKQLPAMMKNRGRTSCALIDADDTHKLVVCNGVDNAFGDYLNAVEMYDFECKQWHQLAASNFSRECAGIVYDAACNHIYVGGGVCDFTSKYAQNKLEFYDVRKNKWVMLHDLRVDHSFYPILWKNVKHDQLLYVASCSSNTVELYDLRSNKTYVQHDLSALFHTKMTKYSRMNRLLK